MVIGITGISGSGKHTAAHFFEQKGWVVLDADKIAHESYRPYTGLWKQVVSEFGEGILNKDDTVNRQALGKIVFNAANPDDAKQALRKLSQMVQPYTRRKIKNTIHRHFRRQSNMVVVAALWKEMGLNEITDKILLTRAPMDLCRERIQKRDHLSGETFDMRIKSQVEPPSPDWVVENSDSKQDLYRQLKRILDELGLS